MSDEANSAGSRIRLLPIHVANQIAAGEVVERPASVVKELMENSVDAGATRIDVAVTAGGRKLISITDNGVGMNRDDALMSIERQATSKIHDVQDIESIHTMGFRGEALASIASVSRLTLRSCARGEDVGTDLVIAGGRIQDVRDTGGPSGTVIEIRDLFFNVPARRKFLRAYQTEQTHIRTTFMVQALAHPEVAMSLSIDGREMYGLPACAALKDRVRDLLGVEYLEQLCPVPQTTHLGVTVSGFVAKPTYTRSDRSEQYVFVNGRPASAPVLYYAIREAYPKLERERKPVVLLFLEMDPGLVDVNVHPTKREVRFRRSTEVRDAVMRAVGGALGTVEEEPEVVATGDVSASSTSSVDGTGLPAATPPRAQSPQFSRQTPLPLGPVERRGVLSGKETHAGTREDTPAVPAASVETGSGLSVPAERDETRQECSPWGWCRVLGQVAKRYVLVETDGGFVVVDPRAAHERILFERLMAQMRTETVASQQLLLPETVELVPKDAMRLRKHLESLTALGFGVDTFGGDAFVVDALPACVADVNCRELLIDVAHGLEIAGTRRGRERWREEAVARAASASAVRQRRTMSDEELAALVSDLASTEMPYTCPRGRPTMIFTSLRELNRKFGRD